jgi:hypothetical protein
VKTEKLLPTHRYVMFLGNKKEKRLMRKELKLKLFPYPKGENRRYDSGMKMRKIDGYDVIIGGEGPLRSYFISLVKKLDLQDRVRLLGWIPQDQMRYYFQAADIFILTSDYEAGLCLCFGVYQKHWYSDLVQNGVKNIEANRLEEQDSGNKFHSGCAEPRKIHSPRKLGYCVFCLHDGIHDQSGIPSEGRIPSRGPQGVELSEAES